MWWPKGSTAWRYLIVKTVTLTGNNGEKIAGKAMVTAAYDKAPVVTMADDATESITLDCGEKGVKVGTSVEEATPFWIVIPPTTFEKGVTIKVMDTNGNEFVQTIDKQVVIERNVVNRMTKFKDNNYAVFYNENGWDESMYFVNGSQVHMKKDETTGNLSNIFAWVIDKNNDLHPVLAEMNEDGMPSKIAYANVDIMISRYDDTTLDMAVFVNDNLVLQADGVVHGLPFSTDSRAWKDNNGWRNTVAVITLGLSVVEIVGSGAAMVGCVASGQLWGVGLAGLGIASGIADFKESYDALFNSPEAVSDDWNSAIRDLSDNSIDMGKELQNKDSKLYKMLCERQSLKDLDVKWSDVKPRGLASLLLSLVDKFFGKTYNSIDQILEFKKHVSVITSLAEDVTASSAQVSAFYSYENTGGVSDINMVPGMRFYKSGDPKASWDLWEAYWTNGHEYKYKLNNLEEYTKYSYVGFYHETVHDWYFFGNERSFRTKDMDDLKRALVELYHSTNGDNWTRNDNWLDFDKPITDWYGITKNGDNKYTLSLNSNNLTGVIDQTFPADVSIELECANNQLTYFNVSDCTSLMRLDVSGCTALASLYCYNNQLVSLNVSDCTALKKLSCHKNQLTSLDISKCTALTNLYCYNNQLTTLDISDCTALNVLVCYNNQLVALDISKCTVLTWLECTTNQLTSLDVSKCTLLKRLRCSGNRLSSLDVSKCTLLVQISCGNNQLTSLDVSKCILLEDLYCSVNQLTSLNASGCAVLSELLCDNNRLISLNVSGCIALDYLDCVYNNLSSLNVSSCKALRVLACSNNQLTSLDVSSCKALGVLVCDNNRLISLNISGCTALEIIECYNNQLTSLDIYGCTALTILCCENNNINNVIPDWFSKLEKFTYDIRYTDYDYEEINEVTIIKYKDNGAGWWYPGEPEKGEHSPD